MSDNNAPLLEIKDLVVSFGTGRRKKEVLHRISFDIKEGECLGLVGESGSGKSTVSNAVMHFIPVEAGRILFRGQDITALHGKKLRQMYRDIQMVFQSPDESISRGALTVRLRHGNFCAPWGLMKRMPTAIRHF